MQYSFIDYAPKSPFSAAVKRVWIGGLLSVGLLLAASFILHLYNGELRAEAEREQKTQETIELQTGQLQRQEAQYAFKKALQLQTSAADQLLRDQLGDLLDLIPDDATLSNFEYNGGGMLFEGFCRRYGALEEGLKRALSGRYILKEAAHSTRNSVTYFRLRFAAKELP